MRALEVFELTGETISAHQTRHRFADIGYDTLTVGVEVERKKLYEAIDTRFDAMVAAGLVEEVRALVKAGYSPEQPPLSTIGYKQIAAYLRGEIALRRGNRAGQAGIAAAGQAATDVVSPRAGNRVA